jgi:hypothetical protein
MAEPVGAVNVSGVSVVLFIVLNDIVHDTIWPAPVSAAPAAA